MAESLSRSEVESLLSALDPKRPGSGADSGMANRDPVANHSRARSSSSLARSAVLFCESVRKRIEAVWEPLLREPVRLKRHMPRTLSFSELLARHQTAYLGFLLESKQDRADLILFIERDLIGPVLARLLGNCGARDRADDLSELEARLLKRTLRECFREPLPFCRWSMTALDRFDFTAERAARTEQTSWWAESWELKTDSMRGSILLAGEWEFVSNSYGSGASSTPEREISEVAELIVEIDTMPLTEEAIRSFQPGDTFPAGDLTEQGVRVLVDGETRWSGVPVIREGRNAVEIERPVQDRE